MANRPDAVANPKLCAVCEAPFTPTSANQTYCGSECRYLKGKFGGRAAEAKAAIGTAECERCGARYPRTHRRSRYCPEHTRKREARANGRTPYDRDATERWRYGVTSAELWEAQGGKCPICGETIGLGRMQYAIDHDHACCPSTETCGKCVRGLLCHSCNRHLGFIENETFLSSALNYLNRG